MKCIIPGSNVKVFGRAIHSLSKIGEELYIEALETGLALRTVNSSRSAYACFLFAPSFFLYYSDEVSDGASSSSEEELLKYKINMKSCLTVFKSLSSLEKTVDKCKIKLDVKEARLVFQLYCRHGIVKTHNLAFIECETLQAVFSKDLCPNIITAQTKLLCDAVLNFQTNQEEVSLTLDPLKVRLKNYTGDETDPQKVIHTEVSLEPDEFENYQVGVDTSVTFCLKELRAILAFSEPSNLPVSLHFETPGKPMVLSMDTDPSFEANFVLATLADKDPSINSSQASQTVNASQRITNNTTYHPEPRTVEKRPIPSRPSTSNKSDFSQKIAVPPTKNNSEPRPGPSHIGANKPKKTFEEHNNNHTEKEKPRQRPAVEKSVSGDTSMRGKTKGKQPQRAVMESGAFSRTMDGTGDSTLGPSERMREGEEEEEDEDMPCSPIIPVHYSKLKENKTASFASRFHVDSDTDDGQVDETIPGTPPAKKKRSLFSGFSQETEPPKSQNYKILASDSEEEKD